MKDMLELLKARQSCRSYSGAQVEEEKLLQIIEAGRIAPSACNSQPWSFVLACSKEKASAIGECTRANGRNSFTENCTAFILLVEEECEAAFGGREHRYYAEMDIGMCIMNMCVMAESLGVGTCILGSFDEKRSKEIAEIPADKSIKLILSLGYASENYPIRDKKRKSTEEILKII